ncbi:hypothetical protein WOLCODRAFT_155565 [Wolfiporia cocos MD-104 SS10]|uniref:SMP domain-containing protein n=1 Tax=Wolfiporia cocos (strain MD-104) TaxID=742152 RepID=A0A2H3IY55_WOLCO|nr:hypothetical protein WOLCODRAFT_155565 [Wolfiporia cocos MD-104 SS10]
MSGKGSRATGGAAPNKATPANSARTQPTQAKSGAEAGSTGFAARVRGAASRNTKNSGASSPPPSAKGASAKGGK